MMVSQLITINQLETLTRPQKHQMERAYQKKLNSPFYMVYIGDDGEVICHHLEPKNTLDIMRLLCRGKTTPDREACQIFNRETNDGRKMDRISNLLDQAISSIITVKEEKDLDSFFGEGETTFLTGAISGLDDFELLCFMVVLGC